MDVVFFDASVLFKAAVTRFLLGAARFGEFRAIGSALVVSEARRNLLAADRPHAAAALEQNIGLVRDPVVAPSDAIAATLGLTDVGARHVLAGAANGGASVLVTSNIRHFDPTEAASPDVAVLTPDRLASSIATRNPSALTRHVQRTPPAFVDRGDDRPLFARRARFAAQGRRRHRRPHLRRASWPCRR